MLPLLTIHTSLTNMHLTSAKQGAELRITCSSAQHCIFFFFKTPSGRLKQVAANRLGALTSGVGVSSKQCKYIRLLKDVNMKTWLSIPRQKSMVPHALSHSVHIKAFITIQSLKACDVHGSQNTHLICAPAFNRNVLKKFQTQKH